MTVSRWINLIILANVWHYVLPHLDKAAEHLQKTMLDLTNECVQTAFLFERV